MALSQRAKNVRNFLIFLAIARKIVQVAGIVLTLVLLFVIGWKDALLTFLITGSLSYLSKRCAALYELRHPNEIAEINSDTIRRVFKPFGNVIEVPKSSDSKGNTGLNANETVTRVDDFGDDPFMAPASGKSHDLSGLGFDQVPELGHHAAPQGSAAARPAGLNNQPRTTPTPDQAAARQQ